MPNVATVLREEILRLARKAVRDGTRKLSDDSATMKHDVADLKRRVTALERENRWLRSIADSYREQEVAPNEEEVEKARITGRMVEKLRDKFNMTQAEFAMLVGVTPVTVLKWEHTDGKLSLRGGSKAALVELRKLTKREAQERLEAAVAEQEKSSKKK